MNSNIWPRVFKCAVCGTTSNASVHCLPNPFIIPSVIQIWDDLHNERGGYYRAFWCSNHEADTGSPVIGYCSPGGSHKTIKACVAEALRLHPGEEVSRNGRIIQPAKA